MNVHIRFETSKSAKIFNLKIYVFFKLILEKGEVRWKCHGRTNRHCRFVNCSIICGHRCLRSQRYQLARSNKTFFPLYLIPVLLRLFFLHCWFIPMFHSGELMSNILTNKWLLWFHWAWYYMQINEVENGSLKRNLLILNLLNLSLDILNNVLVNMQIKSKVSVYKFNFCNFFIPN